MFGSVSACIIFLFPIVLTEYVFFVAEKTFVGFDSSSNQVKVSTSDKS